MKNVQLSKEAEKAIFSFLLQTAVPRLIKDMEQNVKGV